MDASLLISREIDGLEREIAQCRRVVVEQNEVIRAKQAAVEHLRKVLEKLGGVAASSAPAAKTTNGSPEPVRPALAILRFLARQPNGATAGEIYDGVVSVMDTESNDPRNIVQSTLYTLKKFKKVTLDPESRRYSMVAGRAPKKEEF